MWRPNQNGVYALSPEPYDLPQAYEKRIQKCGRSWWAHPLVIIFITLIFTSMDGIVLFNLFDTILTQSELMSYIVSIGVALVLNFLPLIMAKLVYQLQGKRQWSGIWLTLSLIAFALLYSSTVYLRFSCAEMYLPQTYGVGDVAVTMETATEDQRTQAMAVVWLLSIEPLVTSVVNFLLCYFSDNIPEKRYFILRLRKFELAEMIADSKAALHEMTYELDVQLAMEEAAYEAEQDVLTAWRNSLRAEARFLLAQHLADPSATTALSSEALKSTAPEQVTA